MSEACSAVSAALTSASSERDSRPLGSASKTRSAGESSTNTGPESPATPMCGESERESLSQLKSSQAVSPVKTSPSPARAQDSTENARVFGPNTHDSLASFDPATSSWRTSQLSLLGGLDEFSETWPRSGMTRSGTAYRLQPLAPLTGGTASGLWPTPRVSANENRQTKRTPSQIAGTHGRSLAAEVCEAELTKDGLYTTPCADDTGHRKGKYAQGGTPLSAQAGGKLNPSWVEWLMGFPPGWTSLTFPESQPESQTELTDLEPSEMPSSPKSQPGSEAA